MSAWVKVWVMPLSGGAVIWDSTTWTIETRLIPKGSGFCPAAMGPATFELLRANRADSASGGYITDAWMPTKGQYVAITDSTCTTPGVNGFTYWFGVFDSWTLEPIKNTADSVGEIQGVGVGTVLDQVPVANLHRVSSIPAGTPMSSYPTFNVEGLSQGVVAGNMTTGGDSNPQFISATQFAGSLWDRQSMLQHVFAYVATTSAKLPPLNLVMNQAAIGTLLSAAFAEIIPTRGLTIKGILDLLCGSSRGLFWVVTINGSTGWSVTICSASAITIGSIPAAPTTDAVLTGTDIKVVLHNSAFDDYDAVQIEGGNVICCGTVSGIDGTLGTGWSGTLQGDWVTGATNMANFANYTWEQKLALMRQVRSSQLLDDVWTRYVLVQDASNDFNCKAVSGVPVNGSTQPLCPTLSWSGTTLTVGAGKSTPYPPEARLLHTLPWYMGVHGSGVDDRTPEMKMRPNLTSTVVLAYQHPSIFLTNEADPLKFVDLLNPPVSTWEATPSVTLDDRGPAIRIRYSYPEMLAYGAYTMNPLYDEYDPNSNFTPEGAINPASGFTNLIVTVAIRSDQTVRVINYKAGFSASTVRNVLRVDRPDLTCWLVRSNTIIGMMISSAGTGISIPDEVTVDTFVRNDFPIAQKLADELAAFAFRARTGATFILTGPSLPAWGYMGNMIGNVVEQNGVTTPLNTLITNIQFDYSDVHPRAMITTGDAPPPDSTALQPLVPAFGFGTPMSPAMGGTVSASLGSTLPAMAQNLRSAVRSIEKIVSSTPVGRRAESPLPRPRYGIIRWDIINGSEVQLTDINGTSLGNAAIGWIDIVASVLPTLFGNAVYRIVQTGMKTVSGTTRRLYKAVAYISGGQHAFVIESMGSGSTFYGKLESNTDVAITTTIGGVTSNNVLGFLAPSLSSSPTIGFRFDLAKPAQYSYIPSSSPVLMLDWQVRTRKGQRDTSAGIGSLSIDSGESFTLHWWAGMQHSGTSPWAGGPATQEGDEVFGVADFYWKYGSLYCVCGGHAQMVVIEPGSFSLSPQRMTQAGYAMNSQPGAPVPGVIIPVNTATTIFTIPSAPFGSAGGTIQVTITQNAATGRVTAIAMSITGTYSGGASTPLFMIFGGRGSFWKYGE